MVYVNSQASVAKNIIVKINGTPIGEIADEGIPLPIALTEDIEVTNQDSGDFKEYKQGRRDGGECDILGNFVAGDLGQLALAAAAATGSIDVYTVELPSGSIWTFSAVNKSFATPVKNKMIMFECKVKVTGRPILASTVAKLTTPFFAFTASTGTGAILVAPVASDVPIDRIINVANGVSAVTITPTAATGIISVEGVVVATGVASVPITLVAGTPKFISMTVSDTAKATAFYDFYILRAI
jgi:hypothetical protein